MSMLCPDFAAVRYFFNYRFPHAIISSSVSTHARPFPSAVQGPADAARTRNINRNRAVQKTPGRYDVPVEAGFRMRSPGIRETVSDKSARGR